MIVTLHIGLPKTATTVLQARLAANASELRLHGVDYPDLFRDNKEGIAHHKIPELVRSENKEDRNAAIQDILSCIKTAPFDRIVFSSEDMSNLLAPRYADTFWELVHALQSTADLSVVVALRRLDQMFESMYLHSTKTGEIAIDIDAYMSQRHTWGANFFEKLATLRALCGKDRLHLIKYAKSGSYIVQILAALGVDEAWLVAEKTSKARTNSKLAFKQQVTLYHLPEINQSLGTQIARGQLIRAFESGELTFPEDSTDYSVIPPLWSLYYQESSLRWAIHHGVLEYYDAFSATEVPKRLATLLDISALSIRDYCLLHAWHLRQPAKEERA
jgi:hypothetical protein